MVNAIRKELIEIARIKGATCSYSQLNDKLQLGLDFNTDYDRSLIGQWLGEISLHEIDRNRPFLSSLVIRKDGKKTYGEGFYDILDRVYGSTKVNPKFISNMRQECYKFWGTPSNYNNFLNDF